MKSELQKVILAFLYQRFDDYCEASLINEMEYRGYPDLDDLAEDLAFEIGNKIYCDVDRRTDQ